MVDERKGVPGATPDLRQMRYVVAVARAGSFTHAAAALHIAQQAVSQQVRIVEDMLGCALFHRRGRGVETTPAGDAFVAGASDVLAVAELAVVRTREAAWRSTVANNPSATSAQSNQHDPSTAAA